MIAVVVVVLLVTVPGVVLFLMERSREVDAQIDRVLGPRVPEDVSSLDDMDSDSWWLR
jgi:hypothetical protein